MFRSTLKSLACGVLLPLTICTAAQAQQPSSGGTLQLVVTPEPPGIVTGLVTNTPSQMVGGNIFESLLRFDQSLKPMPALAESWVIDAQETTYTFTLRQGVKWHDGKDFSADDVVFSLNTFLPQVNPRWRNIMKAHVQSIEKTSANTIVIKLQHIFDPLLLMFENGSMPMVPKHIYDGTDFAKNPMNNTPVGTGPMKFKEWVAGSHIELVRNPDYYIKGLPRLDRAIFRFIPDAASRAIAFETGQVDVMTGGSLESADVQRLSKTKGVCVSTAGWELFAPLSYFQLNVRSGPLANKTFRKGLMYALDRELIRDVVWSGFGEIADGPISSRTRFHPEKAEPSYDYNPEQARKLIQQSGYKGETLNYLVAPYGEIWSRTAEIAKQLFSDVGVNINLITTDAAGWNQRARAGEYDITNNWPYQYGDPALGVSRMWVSSSINVGSPFSNTGGYSNPEVDKLFERGATASAAERPVIFKQIHNMLADELPALWSVDIQFPTLYRCKVHDFVTTASGANDGLLNAWIEK